MLENDQGLTTDLSIPVSVTPIVNSTSAFEAQIPVVLISSGVVKIFPQFHLLKWVMLGDLHLVLHKEIGTEVIVHLLPLKEVLPNKVAWRRVASRILLLLYFYFLLFFPLVYLAP